MNKDYCNFIADALQIQVKEKDRKLSGSGKFVTKAGVPYTIEIVSSINDSSGGIGVLCSVSGDLYAYLYADSFKGLGGELYLLDGKKLTSKELPHYATHSIVLSIIKKAVVKSYTSFYMDNGWNEAGVNCA